LANRLCFSEGSHFFSAPQKSAQDTRGPIRKSDGNHKSDLEAIYGTGPVEKESDREIGAND
jgi:hypothetical protein